jgi:general secretion pathway protein B
MPAETPVTPPPPEIVLPSPAPPILRPEPAVTTPPTAPSTPARTTATSSRPEAAPSQAAGAETRDAAVRRFADLSPEQRAQLPALSVSGASYSANPAHRMLIVNGAVAYEGQEVAPGLTLERIGLHQAVIRQGSLRFSIAY